MARSKKPKRSIGSQADKKKPPRPVSCKDACKKVTAQQICVYLCDLQTWINQVTTCLQKAGICGSGGGVPANPPNWP